MVAKGAGPVLPVQALAELYHLLVRKGGVSPTDARARVAGLRSIGDMAPTDEGILEAALDLVAGHGLQIFDAIILAAAVSAGCDVLLSEDLQHGFSWKGLTVHNPLVT